VDSLKTIMSDEVQPPQQSSSLRILTVGDGDLSLSLALRRAYGASQRIPLRLVATTLLPSREELVRTYPDSAEPILNELLSSSQNETTTQTNATTTVLFGVDATQLHTYPELLLRQPQPSSSDFDGGGATARDGTSVTSATAAECVVDDDDDSQQPPPLYYYYDYVLFHHPHLGYFHSGNDTDSNDNAESEHADRHRRLLAHYFDSARRLIDPGKGRVHVCLSGTQVHTWRVQETLDRLGLEIAETFPSSKPIFPQYQVPTRPQRGVDDEQQQQHGSRVAVVAAPRKWRNGKLGGRHWLSKWGYRHMPTYPGAAASGSTTTTTSVPNSRHYFIRRKLISRRGLEDKTTANEAEQQQQEPQHSSSIVCRVCSCDFEDELALREHERAPAMPYGPRRRISNKKAKDDEDEEVSEAAADRRRQQECEYHQEGKSESVTFIKHAQNVAREEIEEASFPCSGDSKRSRLVKAIAVEDTDDGKRLRWYLQHVAKLGSKRRCEHRVVREKQVRLNGEPVFDSGRVLRAGDRIEVFEYRASQSRQQHNTEDSTSLEIRVVDSWTENCHVVYKQAGMSVSSGSGDCLASRFSQQQKQSVPCICRTKLDRGCSGLVLLAPQELPIQNITRVFVALVHGIVKLANGDDDDDDCSAKDTIKVNLPVEGIRRWRKKQKTKSDADADDKVFGDCTLSDAEIRVLERTLAPSAVQTMGKEKDHKGGPPPPALSTIMIRTQSPVSGLTSVISHYLRTVLGCPVVGDRFTRSSDVYFALPRSMRNRIKQKLCMGCVGIEATLSKNACTAQRFASSEPMPQKWSARYWDQYCRCKTDSPPSSGSS